MLGRLFVLTKVNGDLNVYYDKPGDRNAKQTLLQKGDVIMFLGRGTHLPLTFLSKKGVIGWNNGIQDPLKDILQHFDSLC